MTNYKIPIEVSARHVHLTEQLFFSLFGKSKPTILKSLSQPGQFVCAERVTIMGPRASKDNVAILYPFRENNQIEVSSTDAIKFGFKAPLRESGDVRNSGSCIIKGSEKQFIINEGVIVPKRHIHFSKEEAKAFNVQDGQIVMVRIESNGRSVIFDDVVCRVSEKFRLAMHIDTDEYNCVNIPGESKALYGTIIKMENLY